MKETTQKEVIEMIEEVFADGKMTGKEKIFDDKDPECPVCLLGHLLYNKRKAREFIYQGSGMGYDEWTDPMLGLPNGLSVAISNANDYTKEPDRRAAVLKAVDDFYEARA